MRCHSGAADELGRCPMEMSEPFGSGGDRQSFEEELRKRLTSLAIDAEVYSEYLIGILEDSTAGESEIQEGLEETISAVLKEQSDGADDNDDLRAPEKHNGFASLSASAVAAEFATQILAAWHEVVQHEERQKKHSKLQFPAGNYPMDSALGIEPSPLEKHKMQKKTGLAFRETPSPSDPSLAEVKKRLIAEFGYEIDETVNFDENGDIIVRTGGKKADTAATDPHADLTKNANKEMVRLQKEAERDKSKAEHEKEMRRRSEQKQKEAEKKEKERQRVAKKERKSGR